MNSINLNGVEVSIVTPEEVAYRNHIVFLGRGTTMDTLDRYSQKNGENRKFTFTLDEAKGVNFNLIDDSSTKNRIDVFVWEESWNPLTERTRGLSNSRGATRGTKSAVGAGEATNRAYGTSSGLRQPKFLGRAVFIHTPYKNIQHLGSKYVGNVNDLVVTDPMDFVPKS